MGDELVDFADRVVSWAVGDEQIEAVVSRATESGIRVEGGEIESLSSAQVQGVGIRVIAGARQGFAYTNSLVEGAVRETLAEARNNASFCTVDEYLGLATPDDVATAELELYRPEQRAVAISTKIATALRLEQAARGADPRISGIESAEYVDAVAEHCIATTTGIRVSNQETACYVFVRALATQRDETQTGFGFSLARRIDDLDVAAAAATAAYRATRRLGATKPASGLVTLVLDPYATAQLIGVIGSTLTGEVVQKGRSLFSDQVGELIASPLITLVDDPTDPDIYTATKTDAEGLATRRNYLINRGVLQGFVHNSYTGRRAGSASTGSAVRGGFASTPSVACMALALSPGTDSHTELVAHVGEGVLVTDITGLHSGVNPASGDFSAGAEGLRITAGEVAEPLREFAIGSTIQIMLSHVSAVGADVEMMPMNATGVSIVIPDILLSGA